MCGAAGLHAAADSFGVGWRVTCTGPEEHPWPPEPGLRVLLGSPAGDDTAPVVIYGGGVRCVLRLPELADGDSLAGFDGCTVVLPTAPREGESVSFPAGVSLVVRRVVYHPWGSDVIWTGAVVEAPYVYVVLMPP